MLARWVPVWLSSVMFLGAASQGDTEYTGTAAETCATVRVRLELLKQKRLPFMRIEKPDALIAVQAGRPLEQAVDTATKHLIEWLVEERNFTPTDAYCLISTCPDFRINVYQMCNIANRRTHQGGLGEGDVAGSR